MLTDLTEFLLDHLCTVCASVVLVPYPGMMARGWSGSPESGTGQTGCELGSQEDSHWRTESDSERTDCGWCAADWTVL